MKRIDTLNARPDLFGVGKAGFSDNADLPGQDATYLSPEWLNMMQEELCNLLELHGIALNPESKQQLYDLLTTQDDLEALADGIETNFIRKNNIVDNLTTDDASRPVSAKQAKVLQDNKLDKTENAASSTKLKTPRKINGIDFDGTQNIDLPLLGYNQSYQNVTASRVASTNYTNSTGRTIFVLITSVGGNSMSIALFINDALVQNTNTPSSYGGTVILAFPVPNGAKYRVQGNIDKWWEF